MILIVKPNSKKSQYQNLEKLSAIEMPIWTLMLANFLNQDCQILDCEAEQLSLTDSFEKIIKLKPDQVHIMAIGSHPSANIQQIDVANKLYELLKDVIKTKVHYKLEFNPIGCGNPDYSRLNLANYKTHNWHSWTSGTKTPYASAFTSISCLFNCKFCQVKDFYGRAYRSRNVAGILCDLRRLYERFGVVNIKLMDEIFAIYPNRIKEMADGLEDIGKHLNIWAYARIDTVTPEMLVNMRRMGIKWLAYGIEHGNEEIRKSIMKGSFDNNKIRDIIKMTKDAGICVLGNFMFGFKDDNYKTMNQTLDFAKELQCEYVNLYCTVAYPGSRLYLDMIDKDEIDKLPNNSEGYAQMAKNFKPLPTKYLQYQEVVKFRDQAFQEYFNDTDYVSMMKNRFGDTVVEEIADMVAVPLEREFE